MPGMRQSAGLPAEPTSFIGRHVELARLAEVAATRRLVTITGVGGVGKTRLALRVARQLEHCFADGVFLIELSALRAPDLLANTVQAKLGLAGQDARPALESVLAYLRDRTALLILDTCEHMVEACGQFARTVTAAAPGVTVLATSRQPLGLPGERTFPVLPLPVPESDAELTPGDAVDLFVQRAATAVPGFALDDDNRADVVMICRRLAGLPLALELAAVRLRALSLAELVAGFDQNMATGARRTAIPRHRDLRAAIGWSYQLCDDVERTLWRRLSVFAWSFSFDSVIEVCRDCGLGEDPVADAVDGLVRKSVLTEDGDRYRLLDPIREFGAAELNSSGEGTAVRSRYIAYYLQMARGFGQHAVDGDQLNRYAELRREHHNIRGAMEYAFAIPGNDRAVADIAASMFLFWHMAGIAWEGEYWVNRALERCSRSSPLRARLLAVRAHLRCLLGEAATAREDATDAIRLGERLGESATVARAHGALHRALVWGDDLASASAIADRAFRLLEEEKDELGMAQVAAQVAFAELRSREPAAAVATAARGVARLPPGELWARAYLLMQEGIGLFLVGEREEGAAKVRRCVTMKHELGDIVGVAYCVGTLGLMAADQERYERAVWLLGAAETIWQVSGRRYTGSPFLEAWQQRATARAREELGPDRFEEVWDRGMSTAPEALALFAVRDVDGPAHAQA